MNTKKHSPAKRGARTKARRRPLHKQVLLHPFSIMVLLCVGVLIAGSTLRVFAIDYNVTATVPADLPSGPAVITSHTHEQHVSESPVTVSGTCPPSTYVALYRNGAFSGVSMCNGVTFQITTDVSIGANILYPKVFNLTNQEGPGGNSVTIFYDETLLPPPGSDDLPIESPPTTLAVDNVESSEYSGGAVTPTSINPTITGFAPPFSDITLAFHSEVTYCRTKANGIGFWSCTLDKALDIGVHRVDIVAVTPEGKRLVFPSFQIRVIRGMAGLKKPAPQDPFLITGKYVYSTKDIDQTFSFDLNVGGGAPPYQLTIDWGDGNVTGVAHPRESTLTIAHVYKKSGTYVVVVRGTDAEKQTALLQLSAAVKGSDSVVGTGSIGPIAGILSGLREWLWLVWPVYIFVILMVVSFWIGEQEGYRQLLARRRTPGKR